MQVVHQDTRRQSNPQQQQIVILQTENNNDIDGTTNRVASVTLESDSLSADQPMSFRSKRRKKIPRKEKMGTEMDLDGKDKMKSSSVEDDNNNNNVALPKGNKTRMDWEMTETIPSSSLISSDVATNYSDVFSDISDESTSDADADDEQSDWPDSCKPPFRSSTNQHGVGHHLLHPDVNSTGGDAVLSGQVLKEVQEFLKDSSKKELFLDKVYRTSAIKQILRQEAVQVQIVKKGRGTVALKKI